MGQVVAIGDYTKSQVGIIRRTIAADLTENEFNMFCEQAARTGLDPFRRQIFPIVFSKDKEKYRRVVIVTGIDGYRALAQRCADYRPDTDEPSYIYNKSLESDLNPLGIERCVVRCFKHSHGEWHTISAAAYWDEFVVLQDVWANGKKTGKKLADTWKRMPRLMIAKVAEAQALRRGWPETFSGLYTDDEIERSKVIDATATEIVAQEEQERRIALLKGSNAVIVDWLDGKALDRVPMGEFYDGAVAWASDGERSASEIAVWRDRNRPALQEFWAAQGHDALELKKALEGMEKRLTEADDADA